jgi:hypothetical protein
VHDALTTRVVSDGDGVIDEVDHFSLAELFGVEDPPIRLTELASPELFIKRLIQCFGEDQENFTMEMAEKLHSFVHANLENDTSMEFTSALGSYPSILPWGCPHTRCTRRESCTERTWCSRRAIGQSAPNLGSVPRLTAPRDPASRNVRVAKPGHWA